ncbi:MAG: c-type cytochrome [Gammaproteobacteria bacterium]
MKCSAPKSTTKTTSTESIRNERRPRRVRWARRGWLLASLACAGPTAAVDLERGEYLLHASGCVTCHTADDDGAAPLAGGHALETPFGVFYTPNITPDPDTGIGRWSDDDFVNALWHGVAPDGSDYFPAFPYTAYTGMSRDDALAIKAYLLSLEPVRQENRAHELEWYLSSRLAAWIWKLIKFSPARFTPDPTRSDDWNRGAYLVRHLGHCGECHTPRDALGGLLNERELAGNPAGPNGKKVPDITANRDTGIGHWSDSEIEFFLEMGMLPDGDFTGGAMSPVIDDNTSRLTTEDQQAIAAYLRTVPDGGT